MFLRIFCDLGESKIQILTFQIDLKGDVKIKKKGVDSILAKRLNINISEFSIFFMYSQTGILFCVVVI